MANLAAVRKLLTEDAAKSGDWDHLRPGDTVDKDKPCMARAPEELGGYYCSRTPQHNGQHVALASTDNAWRRIVCCVWIV